MRVRGWLADPFVALERPGKSRIRGSCPTRRRLWCPDADAGPSQRAAQGVSV